MLETQEALERALVPTALELAGGQGARVTSLAAGASTRRYHRVEVQGGIPSSLIVMELAENPLRSDEVAGATTSSELPFVNIRDYLERGGIAVPRLYRYSADTGLLFLEDLGDRTLESAVLKASRETQWQFYALAIADLVRLQRYTTAADPRCVAFGRQFDYDLLLWELDHFREWFLEAERGVSLTAEGAKRLQDHFERIARMLADQPRIFVHRDYQSRNLMVQDGPRLRLLDFQDALLGPAAYDLVALLRDSYVELAPELLDALLEEYIRVAQIGDAEAFRRLFHLQTLQRKLKDAGRFVFIDRVKKNPTFLPSIPASLRYVRASLERLPELHDLHGLLVQHVPELGPVR